MVLLTVHTHGRNNRKKMLFTVRMRTVQVTEIVMYRALPCAYAHGHNCPRNLFIVRAPTVQVTAIIYHAWSNVLIKNYKLCLLFNMQVVVLLS